MSSFVKLIKNEYPKTNKEADSHMKNFLDFGDNKIEFYKDQDYEKLKNDKAKTIKMLEDLRFVTASSIAIGHPNNCALVFPMASLQLSSLPLQIRILANLE